MKSIIIGCGRVGAGLAQSLWQCGQVVIVVDHETTAFERFGTGFKGQTLLGAGLDREVLLPWSASDSTS
jgi:trk system potassium uptake protein TrkA